MEPFELPPSNKKLLTEDDIARSVIDRSIYIHRKIGPGLLESVYEIILARELEKIGLNVRRQACIPITWDDCHFEQGLRADILVEEKVIVELKSVEKLIPIHGKQLLTYLRLSGLRLGLLVNFGERLMKNGIRRVVNGLPE